MEKQYSDNQLNKNRYPNLDTDIYKLEQIGMTVPKLHNTYYFTFCIVSRIENEIN